ncbi:MAG: hypothetical protein LQ351_003310 [Letrouitia transgressa]|nr:MAG: hypothetical protein LQ351_003310 [Letrouitia transgressa]
MLYSVILNLLPLKETSYPTSRSMIMAKDSTYNYIHFSAPRIADLFEVSTPSLYPRIVNLSHLHHPNPSFPSITADPGPLFSSLTNAYIQEFTRSPHLPHESIHVPPHLQPPNPEDEDDVVPDQHAAFGITRATQGKREPQWKDLGLEALMKRGPGKKEIAKGLR